MKLNALIVALLISFFSTNIPSYAKDVESKKVYIKHKVVKGDNLYLISAYYLNNPRLWKEIYNINKDKIPNPNVLTDGIYLKIPVEKKKFKPRFSIKKWRERNNSK